MAVAHYCSADWDCTLIRGLSPYRLPRRFFVMIRSLAFVLAIASLPGLASASITAPPAHRQVKQNKRIFHGAKSGQLTRREARRLHREQRHIQRTKRRMKRDGVITPRERRRLNRKQNRANRHIYRAKHNRRRR